MNAVKGDSATVCNDLRQKISLAPPLIDIAAQKQQALQRLLEGNSVTKTAEAVGIDRSTLHRWLREPRFIAERNRLAKEARDACQERLRHLATQAVEVVAQAVEAGNLKAALNIIKIVGLGNVGPGDEETAERRILCRLVEKYCLENFLTEPFDRQRYGSKAPLHNENFIELKNLIYSDLITTQAPSPSEAEEAYQEAVIREEERLRQVAQIRERVAAIQKRRQAQQ
ncbi:MAG: helix-turn-helix domain-containing protein [Veillonellaceae bacterium]|nr:helix-turn-helix domain-containing protein [Veillonellaceae bacterium]